MCQANSWSAKQLTSELDNLAGVLIEQLASSNSWRARTAGELDDEPPLRVVGDQHEGLGQGGGLPQQAPGGGYSSYCKIPSTITILLFGLENVSFTSHMKFFRVWKQFRI